MPTTPCFILNTRINLGNFLKVIFQILNYDQFPTLDIDNGYFLQTIFSTFKVIFFFCIVKFKMHT